MVASQRRRRILDMEPNTALASRVVGHAQDIIDPNLLLSLLLERECLQTPRFFPVGGSKLHATVSACG